jgi:hypothetical protein
MKKGKVLLGDKTESWGSSAAIPVKKSADVAHCQFFQTSVCIVLVCIVAVIFLSQCTRRSKYYTVCAIGCSDFDFFSHFEV